MFLDARVEHSIIRHFALSHDVSTRVWDSGGTGPVVVLLHGLANSLEIWERVWPSLAKRFRVVAFDWPGFGEGNEVGKGVARLELQLPAGLYAVGWSATGSNAESIVRVVGGGETFLRPPWEAAQAERPTTTAVFDLMSRGLASSGGADFLVSNYLGSTRAIDRSSLIVELVDPEGGLTADLLVDLRVLDGSDREVEPVASDLIPGSGNAKAWAEVTSGRYRLRFRAMSGETLDQVVPVLKDRTTVVRMLIANATVMVHGSEGFTNTRSRGVDPARTVIVTSVMRDAQDGFDEQFRLAQLLLLDLALKHSSLSDEFLDRLSRLGTDPLLRVYGALVILSRLEAGLRPRTRQAVGALDATLSIH